MRVALGPLLLALSSPLAGACGPAAPPARPSIVLISIDTLRADHLSCYGYHRPTPHIDALAREGVRFDEAHATAPWTLPSHMSVFTGRFPSAHRVEEDGQVLAPEVGLLAEALSRAGYRTAGFVAHHYLDGAFGFARGFDVYALDQYRTEVRDPLRVVRGDAVVDRALDWLRAEDADGRPYFLFVHLFDPHFPYAAPPPFAGRYSAGYAGGVDGSTPSILRHLRAPLAPQHLEHLIDLYDEEIAFTDELVGRLLGGIRQRTGGEDSVVLLTSDHGEEFKEHGSLGHALTLYREQSHVPLILNDPASEFRGTQVSAAVRHVDIAPTLAEIARLDPADPFVSGLTGMPLTRHLGAEPRPEPLPVVVESTRWGPRRSAVSLGGRKAIAPMTYRWWFARPGREGSWTAPWVRGLELYDVDADPGETRRLASAPGDPALARLAAWREQAWRGVHLTLQLAPEWEGELRLDPATVWADEPRLEDELRLHPLELAGGRIALSGRAARPLRLLLPVDPASAGSLEIHSLRGDLAVFDGSDWRTIEAGSIETLDLAGLPVDAAPPPRLPDGSSAVLRVRRLAPRERLVVDEKTRQLLEDLGYGR